jgi:hypothetical protein
MNFAQVREAIGKLDEKNYQIKIAMFGTPQSFDGVTFTPEGKRFQQVFITDDIGETNKVKIYLGEEKTIGDGCIGKRLAFQIAPVPFKNKMYYGGFWNDRATVAPARTPTKPSVSTQGASKAPAPTQTTPKPDWDAIAEGKVRHGLLCAYIQGGSALSDDDLYKQVLQDTKFVMQGEYYFEPEPDKSITENNQQTDDIPF